MAESTKVDGRTRHDFLRNAALASGGLMTAATVAADSEMAREAAIAAPNVLMICADQLRAGFVGAMHENRSVITPHIDSLAERGVNRRQCMSNQPLCSPSRAFFMTGRFATETAVWKLGVELDHSLPTIATEFRKSGYKSNFIGKWHVSQTDFPDGRKQQGWRAPGSSRAGFDDPWEGANVLELVSHPYEGNYWDNQGNNIGFKDEYRVLMPTLLDGAGIAPPASLRGKPLKGLATNAKDRKTWDSTAYLQLSQSVYGRGIRTKAWCYCALDSTVQKGEAAYGTQYQDFALYSLAADPAQRVNLVGRATHKSVGDQLRVELEHRIVAAGEPTVKISPVLYYA